MAQKTFTTLQSGINADVGFVNEDSLVTAASVVASNRILYTPSIFARTALLHLQEIGTLQAKQPHTSNRENLYSYLCFVVISGSGKLTYSRKTYDLYLGDVVFIDCRNAYSHSTGECYKPNSGNSIGCQGNKVCGRCADGNAHADLWALQWVHFYGPSLRAIYEKYQERGGQPVFHPKSTDSYTQIIAELHNLADSSDYIRDMRINEKLGALLTLLMKESWHPENSTVAKKSVDLSKVKIFLDEHYAEKISLDDLSKGFFINKYYLTKIFKEAYGLTITSYILSKRITKAKNLLRFTDMSMDAIGALVGMNDANYFSRSFKKVEGLSPGEFRKRW